MVFKALFELFGKGRQEAVTPLGSAKVDIPAVQSHGRPRRALVREEILDTRCRIGGYRYRPADGRIGAEDYREALDLSERVQSFAETRLAVIHLEPDQWGDADFAGLVGRNTFFELPLTGQTAGDADWLDRVARIRATGAGVALALEAGQIPVPAMQDASLVFVDIEGQAMADFESQMRIVKRDLPVAKIAVRGVTRWSEQRYCLSLGAAYLLGDFVDAPDDEVAKKEISESRNIIMEMLNMMRQDAELKDLAGVAKRDPATSLQLLTMANSPLSGFTRQVASIDQAIMALGRDALYRWLTMTLFRAGGASPRMDALLEHALYRGRFLELMGAERFPKTTCDELFLLGLLSYTDVLLDLPMRDVLQRMQVVDEVRTVLLSGEGRLAPYLELVMSLQRGAHARIAALCDAIGVDEMRITELHTTALDWSSTMVDQ
ncbi:MAG: HDOD domain-containing protein [Rhodocyclaceae bacterium]|nr:HDOD domain-containing protein [Rhodocyclaceae bacterium]MDZ4213236.1 HDOD domain-containing protein [Rhodocyclaceae bacterium]